MSRPHLGPSEWQEAGGEGLGGLPQAAPATQQLLEEPSKCPPEISLAAGWDTYFLFPVGTGTSCSCPPSFLGHDFKTFAQFFSPCFVGMISTWPTHPLQSDGPSSRQIIGVAFLCPGAHRPPERQGPGTWYLFTIAALGNSPVCTKSVSDSQAVCVLPFGKYLFFLFGTTVIKIYLKWSKFRRLPGSPPCICSYLTTSCQLQIYQPLSPPRTFSAVN